MLTIKAVVNAFDKGKSKAFVLPSSGKLRVGIASKVNTKRSHLFASHDLCITVITYMWEPEQPPENLPLLGTQRPLAL